MTELIDSVESKLERGRSQAGKLNATILSWCTDNKFSVRCELSEKRLGFRVFVKQIPERLPFVGWGLDIGEWAHNLRSTLDNLAFALARLKKDPPDNPKQIYFPISQIEENFEKSETKKICQLPTEAINTIRKIQPFNRNNPDVEGSPDQDPLVLLQWLNNKDKHQVPSVVLIAPKEMQHSHSYKFYSEKDADLNIPPDVTCWAGPLQPGIPLIELKTNRPIESASGQVTYTGIAALETCQGRLPVIDVLTSLTSYTELVVSQFRDFFK